MAESEKEEESTKVAEESSLCAGEGKSSDLDPRFECPICISWLKDPVLTICGHKFCSDCINTWLIKQGAACPVDSKPLNPGTDLFPDLFTKREIAQQITDCLYREYGCTIKLSPVDLENHLSECPYKKNAIWTQPNCPFKNHGCCQVFETTESLKRHLEENISLHMMMIETSLSQLILKSNIDAKSAEAKSWDAPKKGEDEISSEPESQSLIHELYEKVVVLEQRNHELTFALKNLESTICERTCNGSYIWKLEFFEEKLKAMIANRLNMNFSPSFYTSPSGYKVCARVNVSHGNSDFLSLVLHLSKSEHDDTLEWPFEGWISFLLVHPEDPNKSIFELAKSQPNLEAFQKPVDHINRKSYGFTQFVSIKSLENFVKNDCVVIRIEVKAISKLDKMIKATMPLTLFTEENLRIHTEV